MATRKKQFEVTLTNGRSGRTKSWRVDGNKGETMEMAREIYKAVTRMRAASVRATAKPAKS